MMSDPSLAKFQARLLALLSSEGAPDEILRSLKEELEGDEYRAYLDSLEPPLVEIAVDIVKKWCKDSAGS